MARVVLPRSRLRGFRRSGKLLGLHALLSAVHRTHVPRPATRHFEVSRCWSQGWLARRCVVLHDGLDLSGLFLAAGARLPLSPHPLGRGTRYVASETNSETSLVRVFTNNSLSLRSCPRGLSVFSPRGPRRGVGVE